MFLSISNMVLLKNCMHKLAFLLNWQTIVTVKPLNGGRTGERLLSVGRPYHWGHTLNLKLVNRFNTEECGLQEAESANHDQTHSERAKINKYGEYPIPPPPPNNLGKLSTCARNRYQVLLSSPGTRLASGILKTGHMNTCNNRGNRQTQLWYSPR